MWDNELNVYVLFYLQIEMWSSIVKLIMLEMDMILDVSARLDFNSVIDNDWLNGLNFVDIL